MDIGAEISKKIQMAITAKLKELNAYVDDELPDYIMIMVANKKTEAQMREALSLFLSDNTENFTSWLHNLLATLRKTKSDKKHNTAPKQKNSECTKVGEEQGSVQQQTMNKDEVKTEMTLREPVITINPESDDMLDKELQADTPISNASKPQISVSQPEAKISTPLRIYAPKSSSKSGADRQSVRKRIANENTQPPIREERSVDEPEQKRPKKMSKNKGSVSSTVSQVIQNPSFVSDDDSDCGDTKPKVSSKVAYPKRKMRVPLNKQANKALLMRAVSEAEKSVRGRDDGAELKLKGRSVGLRSSTTAQTRQMKQEQQSVPKKQKKKSNQRATKIRRQVDVAESLLQSQSIPNSSRPRDKVISSHAKKEGLTEAISVKVSKKRILRSKSDSEERRHAPLVSDKRKFIVQTAENPVVSNAPTPVKFDSRVMKCHSDGSLQSSSESGKKQKMTARVTPTPHNPDDQIASHSAGTTSGHVSTSGPVFIVTLDGVVSSKQTKFKTTNSLSETAIQTQKTTTIAPKQATSSVQKQRHAPVIPKPRISSTVQNEHEDDNRQSLKYSTNTELEQMKKKMLELQTEAAKLKKLQATLVAARTKRQGSGEADDSGQSESQCSISISNVHYSTTEKQLSDYFSICGKVERVTLLKDKRTVQPTGFAYLEFESKRAVSSALALNNSRFNDRVIKVTLKQDQPAVQFPAARGMYRPRRPTGVRGFRRSRFHQYAHKYTTKYVQKPQAKNRTWVNPLLTKK